MSSANSAPDRRSFADRRLGAGLASLAALVFAFLLLPVVVIVVMSFSGARSASRWGGFSAKWWPAAFDDPEILRAAGNSVAVAFSVALLATAIGTSLALGLRRRARTNPSPGRTAAWNAGIAAPILLPDIVQGVALLIGFRLVFGAFESAFGWRPSFGRTTIALAHTTFAASYVAMLVRARLATIPPSLHDAALDLGATPWQAFRRIELPLLAPAVLAGAALAFTLSLDEYVLTFFTSGPGSDTLPVYVESSARRGATPKVNVVSTVLVLGSGCLAALVFLAPRRRSH